VVAEQRPLRFISLPGLIAIAIGLILGIYTLESYNASQMFTIPFAIVGSILLVVGVIAFLVGLLLYVLPSLLKKHL
jgi:hypothetical protein